METPKRVQGDGTVIHNTRRFYDGKERTPALNMQIVTDAQLVAQVVTVNHVGSTFDGDAFESSCLKDVCIDHPFPYHWIGDSAYNASRWMMTPRPGNNLHVVDPPRDWFNLVSRRTRTRTRTSATTGI